MAMFSHNRPIVVGVFENRDDAHRAVAELERMGFGGDQIGFASRGGDAGFAAERGEAGAADNAGAGLAAGAIVGGIIGAGAALLIPGIGPIVAGGVLASVLGGAAVGAAAGGLLGALVGMGVPEEEARYYDEEFQAGRTIVTVKAGDRSAEAANVMRRFGAYDAEARAGAPDEDRSGGMHSHLHQHSDGTVHEHAHHHQPGQPEIHDDPTHERTTGGAYTTERNVVHGTPTEMPVYREEVGSERTTGTTGRSYDTYPGWAEAMPEYRRHWETDRGGQGRWEDEEPYYRYRHEMGQRPEYQGKRWEEVEPHFRRDWESRYPDRRWDEHHPRIRNAWDVTFDPAERRNR